MILVGASCTTSTEQTNANKEQTAASVTPASSVENSATPAATPENENTNSSSVDTSDWLTYENAEYGFSLKYPKNWTVNATTTPGHSNIIIETAIIESLSDQDTSGPQSRISPQTQAENNREKIALLNKTDSYFGGQLKSLGNISFFQYTGFIENGTILVEYVTYIDETKISILYMEGDNADYAKTLEKTTRNNLLEQYKTNTVADANLAARYQLFNKTLDTFQHNN